MCHEARRNSPSVMPCNPTSSCIFTTLRIAASSMARNSAAEISLFLKRSRASRSSGGRSKLPTWSARKGGRLVFMVDSPKTRKHFPCVALEDLVPVAVADRQCVQITLRVVEVVPRLGIDATHRTHHFRSEEDVLGGYDLEQQLDAGQVIHTGIEEHVFQQVVAEQRALQILREATVPAPVIGNGAAAVRNDEAQRRKIAE